MPVMSISIISETEITNGKMPLEEPIRRMFETYKVLTSEDIPVIVILASHQLFKQLSNNSNYVTDFVTITRSSAEPDATAIPVIAPYWH